MGDFPSHLVRAPRRPRFGRLKATAILLLTFAMCLPLTGATAAPVLESPAFAIAGMRDVPAPPAGPSWAPAPRTAAGLSLIATAGRGRFALHTAGGDVTFLPGVNLGPTVPGHLPGELAIGRERYRTWFAGMGWLGLRVVRVATLHPPAFYRELAAHNRANPDRPLYLMQGVHPPTEAYDRAFAAELRDASDAVAGDLTRPPAPGRAAGTWDTDVTPWLAGWTVGRALDPDEVAATDRRYARTPRVDGSYFRSTPGATPTERRLAAAMDQLAGHQAARGLSRPIAFVNRPGALTAGHVRPTASWPAGTFASLDAYAEGLADRDVPVLVTSFGVPSSIGAARPGPRARAEGDHSERDAMRINADLLRLIRDRGLAGGLLATWADEWPAYTRTTLAHQDPERRQLWHDPLTAGEHLGLVATDAAGSPEARPAFLLDDTAARPVRRATARVDEAYVHLRLTLGDALPARLTLGFDVLPGLTGAPPPGAAERMSDAAFTLDVVRRAGQAYLREEIDPLPLDGRVPVSARGPAPAGWRQVELLTDAPDGIQAVGRLRYGPWDPADPDADSRALWRQDGDDLVVRVPWAMLGFADPSAHMVGVPARGRLRLVAGPSVGLTVSAAGTDQFVGDVTWVNWNRPYWTERLKAGASAVRDAALEVVRPPD